MVDQPYGLPEDFAEFWKETVEEALHAPLDYHISVQADPVSSSHIVHSLQFSGVDGRRLNGWFAYPEGARRNPGFLWIPPYGRESVLPNAYGTRAGMVSLSFNLHGESAYHQEKYIIERGYFADGAASPETWVFRRFFQDTVIATRVLQAQIEVDEDKLGVAGMSQGGGLTIWNAAWNPLIKAACADMPFLSTIGRTLLSQVYRYPLKELRDFMDALPLGEERVLHTLSYFDTVHHARFVTKPTHVSLGLKDPATRPDTVRALFEALAGPKELLELDWGHDWHPQMVEANLNWFAQYL